jgi:serine/threonine protein kinase/Tfp pilus assembly protein PilF
MIGKIISHYKITEELGRGGMGVVYKAHDTRLDRDVALKFLPHYLKSDQTEKERFYHEARAAAALTHQNIAVIYEVAEHDGQIFIAMEFVEGKTLKQLLQSKTPPVGQVLDIGIQVCDGLAAAHEKGIVHRDIKSENIMLTPKGQVKIMDFGLAKVKGATKLTKTGSTLGTAAYMSPEQVRGEEVDRRSDIFSFGVVLYELLTGKLPFRGDHPAALAYSIANEAPQPITRLNEKVISEIEHILAKALEKNKEDRYQHMDDLLCDLRRERKKLEYARAGYTSATSGTNRSIAVLPFRNMSDSKEDEYFSDGLTEDVIAQLSKIHGIEKVIARTSVMRYKQSDKRIRDIAKELDVATVLEGSVRRAGNQVRIVAQLIDAASEGHLWADTYDKEMTEIFAIQSEVAQRIASALNMRLSAGDKEKIDKKQTEHTEAYQLYLKGRYHWNKRMVDDIKKAVNDFNQAIEKDPSYALAYAGLAQTYVLFPQFFALPTKEYYPKAKAAAKRALELDENLAEAYSALGLVNYLYAWDWPGAEREFKKAIALNPNYPTAHHWYCLMLNSAGRMEEAMNEIRRAQELDPLSPILTTNVGWVLFFKGRYDEAIEECEKALALDENFVLAHFALGNVYCQKGMLAEAIAEYQKTRMLAGSSPLGLGWLGYTYARSGMTNEAYKMLDELLSFSKQGYVVSYGVALIYNGLTEEDMALDWLEKAFEERDRFVVDVNIEPALDNLRSKSRFKALLLRMRLQE